MVIVELAEHNVGSERTSRVEGTASEHDAPEFCYEQSETDTNWCQESPFVLLSSEHEAGKLSQKQGLEVEFLDSHREDQEDRAEHLNE